MGVVKPGDSPYENARNQRLQENRKRLQELGLTELSKDLTSTVAQSKSPTQPRQMRAHGQKEKVKVQLRRSTRNSSGHQPDYVEVEIDIRRRVRFDNTGGTRHYSRLYERKYASDEARESATEKAEAIKKGLPETNPSFVKPMLQSHVTGGFWLGLPVSFCRDYLPKKDERIILEDEKKEEWETIYLAYKTGLSGGWRGFSLDHNLVDGDALVFELVEPHRFKVHIVRVYGSDTEQEKLGEENANVQAPQDAYNANVENKVRQRLIWEDKKKGENDLKQEVSCEHDGALVDDDKCFKKRKHRSGEEERNHLSVVKVEEQYSTSANANMLVKKEVDTNSNGNGAAVDDKDCKNAFAGPVENMCAKKEMDTSNNGNHDIADRGPPNSASAGTDTKMLVKEEMGSSSHGNHDIIHAPPITWYQQNAPIGTIFTKEEMEASGPAVDDVKNVHLLHPEVKMEDEPYNESSNHAKDLTSYMKAKKRFDMSGKVKKEMSVW